MSIPQLLCIGFIFLMACQPADQGDQASQSQADQEITDASAYPETLWNVMEEHGGLHTWKTMKSMSFEIAKENGVETHRIALQDRRDRIEGPNFIMGFDGSDTWIEADSSYDGDPEFYHNLMFYFFAMPFVLADDGTNYQQGEPLEFDGTSYPGIRVSYDTGVGASPKDEYFLHYHPDTYQMEWLGYTVTYFSNESSDDIHWIRYTEWEEVQGLKLPRILTWFNYENGKPTEPRNDLRFSNVELSKETPPDRLFTQPSG